MTTWFALSLLVAGLVLTGWELLVDPVGFRRARAIGGRLSRLLPARDQSGSTAQSERGVLASLERVLRVVDPGLASTEAALRSMGVLNTAWCVGIELVRTVAGIAFAFAAFQLAIALIPYPWVPWLVPVVAFLLFVVATERVLKGILNGRLRRIRSELALGVEFLCIFLEGGQTLDQAFRSFCEICGQALPRIAVIQNALVSDLKNGVPYEKAIERWAENLNVEEAKPLAALFIDSLVHGTEVVPHLRQFGADLAERRVSAARASIGTKSAQLSVVMVAFFLPAILAFVTAPAITALLSTLNATAP
jgi:tight adherence protein C